MAVREMTRTTDDDTGNGVVIEAYLGTAAGCLKAAQQARAAKGRRPNSETEETILWNYAAANVLVAMSQITERHRARGAARAQRVAQAVLAHLGADAPADTEQAQLKREVTLETERLAFTHGVGVPTHERGASDAGDTGQDSP